MQIRRLPRGWFLDWFHGEVVVGVMDSFGFARLTADEDRIFYSRLWNHRTSSGRFFGFRIRRFVVSGWLV